MKLADLSTTIQLQCQLQCGRVGWHGGLGWRARWAGSAGTAGRVGGPGGARRAGRSGPGGVGGAGRVVLEERAGWVRIGLGRVVPAVNVPMNGSLRCVCLRSWHVG